VSEGDLLCEQLIIDYFRKFGEKTILVSEESCKVDLVEVAEGSMIVTVDPIDGTENFVSGLKEWGIGVSIFIGNKHLESMIALPELNEFLITGQKIVKYKSRISGISSSLTKEDLQSLEDGFEYRIIGCSMYNMFNVIRGSYNSFENPKGAYSWDILPGLNLAIEHKLDVTVENKPYNGEFLQPNTRYRFRISNV
jgi:myo-inositol-1(or 4)-monophosphatase